MKLIYCDNCHDVVRLIPDKWRLCECKQSGGQYNLDFATATIGGKARVFGIANPFFDKIYQDLTEFGKVKYRKDKGYGDGKVTQFGTTDCWWGEFDGDLQIFRIEDAKGPKLKIKIEYIKKENQNKIIFQDKRDYWVNNEKNVKFVKTEYIDKSSYKTKVKRK